MFSTGKHLKRHGSARTTHYSRFVRAELPRVQLISTRQTALTNPTTFFALCLLRILTILKSGKTTPTSSATRQRAARAASEADE